MVPYRQLCPGKEIGSEEFRNSPISSMNPTSQSTPGSFLREWDDILLSPALPGSQEDSRGSGNPCDDGAAEE